MSGLKDAEAMKRMATHPGTKPKASFGLFFLKALPVLILVLARRNRSKLLDFGIAI